MIRNWLLLSLLSLAFCAKAQYSESFSLPLKGYQIDFVDDFDAVNWSLTSWDQATGLRDGSDYFNTTAAGVLECIDLDQEVCWESPLLNTTAAPTLSLKVDLSWTGFDSDIMANDCSTDYIRVWYSVNGGAYVMVTNIAGGNACATVAYPFENPGMAYSGTATINQAGITGGNSLQIRICVFTNANAETVTIDNVNVPQMGVKLSGGAVGVTDFPSESGVQIFPSPASEFVQITMVEASSGAIRVLDLTGQVMAELAVQTESLQINVANWPSGMYFVEHRDAKRIWAVKRLFVHH